MKMDFTDINSVHLSLSFGQPAKDSDRSSFHVIRNRRSAYYRFDLIQMAVLRLIRNKDLNVSR